MHPLASAILQDIQDNAQQGKLSHPRDLKTAALAYYRYFTALITGASVEQEPFPKKVDRILEKWESLCEAYDAEHTAGAPVEKMYTECHTGFTELLNWLNGTPDTPLRFRKLLAEMESATPPEPEAAVEKAAGKPTEDPYSVLTDESVATSAPPVIAAAVAKPTVEKKSVINRNRSVRKLPPIPAPPIPPARPKVSDQVYKLRIGLEGAEDAIWRRVYVPASIELADLHRLIQLLFDWNGERAHRFKVNYDYFGPANPDGMDQRELYDGVTLESIYTGGTNKLRYTYDFADKWEHLILIEKTVPRDPGVTYPLCTNGAGHAPLDGSGGTDKYCELVAGLEDKQSARYELACDILGRDWEAEYFAEGEVNKLLRKRW